MLTLKTKKTENEGYFETTLIVDTGTSVVSVDFGIMHSADLEVFGFELAEEAEKTLKKVGAI